MEKVRFNADEGGWGDVMLAAWIVRGYELAGLPAEFCATKADRVEFLRRWGFEPSPDTAGAMPLGDKFGPRKIELTVNRGRTGVGAFWASRLPGTPFLSRPSAQVPAEDERWAVKTTKDRAGPAPLALIFPYAAWKPREWPVAYWCDLAWQLENAGIRTITLGPAETAENLKGFPFYLWGHGWPKLMALMREAAWVIGNDSGPAHVAGTLGTRTLAIMGPTVNIFAHCPEVQELAIDAEELGCVGCYFDKARGFRAACDKACRALMLLKPEPIAASIVAGLKLAEEL